MPKIVCRGGDLDGREFETDFIGRVLQVPNGDDRVSWWNGETFSYRFGQWLYKLEIPESVDAPVLSCVFDEYVPA